MPCNDCACTCMSAAVEAQVADFAASPIAAIEKSIAAGDVVTISNFYF